MNYQENLLNDVKLWLGLGDELDLVLNLIIDTSIYRVISHTFREESEIETNKILYKAIMYDAIISFNKRFNEGKKSNNISGVSESFESELEIAYNQLLSSLKTIKVPL